MKRATRYTTLPLAALTAVFLLACSEPNEPPTPSPEPVQFQTETHHTTDREPEIGQATIATEAQKIVEQDAINIMKSDAMLAEIATSMEIFAAHPWANSPDGQRTMEEAVYELAGASAFLGAISDTHHPKLAWMFNAPREWLGYKVPGSRWAVDNVDNMYRMGTVDDQSVYELTFTPSGPMATQVSITIYDNFLGENDTKLDDTLSAYLVDESTHFNEDGSFTVTLTPNPDDSLPNQMLNPQRSRQLLIRETIADWQNYNPLTIDIRRVGGPPANEALSYADYEKQAVFLLSEGTPTLLNFQNLFANFPENGFSKIIPRAREAGEKRRLEKFSGENTETQSDDWGFVATGRFNLKEDHALLITVDPMGCKFMGLMLTSPWLVSLEHVHASGSRNIGAAEANADGTYTYVISPVDPGIHNWLDSRGLSRGGVVIRWQELTRPVPDPDAIAIRKIEQVPVENVAALLPEATPVTQEQRQMEIDKRAAGYQRRCGNIPCDASNRFGMKIWED
jgi:Protein of unknown function (DUF1214)